MRRPTRPRTLRASRARRTTACRTCGARMARLAVFCHVCGAGLRTHTGPRLWPPSRLSGRRDSAGDRS